MAFKFVPYAPEGSGGKDPILGELVVTENGVYDEPVISNAPEPITWDGIIGDKITVDVGNGMTFVKVSDKALSAEDLVGATIVLLNTATTVLTSDMISSSPGGVVLPELAAVSVSDAEVFSAAMSVPFSETGTYFVYSANTGVYTESLTFPEGVSTPADGWNKVTVNVAGGSGGGDSIVVDVEELPTENVDDSKIYRVAEYADTVSIYWNDGTSISTIENAMERGLIANGMTVEGGYFRGDYRIVDVLPEPSYSPNTDTMTVPVYILKETGEAFLTPSSGQWTPVTEIAGMYMAELFGNMDFMSHPYKGIANSTDDMTDVGYYTLFGREVVGAIYGIPNAHPVKRLVDGAWVDLA